MNALYATWEDQSNDLQNDITVQRADWDRYSYFYKA